jgi:hypothetical protein
MALVLLAIESLHAAEVKISFLDNTEAIQQTSNFLLSKGFDTNSVNTFRVVDDWYNGGSTDLDLKKFPKREHGFYSFSSVSNLIGSFQQPLIYTYHQNELNCFETVILLAGDRIQTSLQPDDVSEGPFVVPKSLTNNIVMPRGAATPRDAFAIVTPQWWLDMSKGIFSNQNKRICLTAAFDSFYLLPKSTIAGNEGSMLLTVVQSSWKREGIEFPRNMQIVICYDMTLDSYGNRAVSSHAGLLFKDGQRYVVLEKNGNSAPYVRFDFSDLNDLYQWLFAEIQPTMDIHDALFAIFCDDKGQSIVKLGK